MRIYGLKINIFSFIILTSIILLFIQFNSLIYDKLDGNKDRGLVKNTSLKIKQPSLFCFILTQTSNLKTKTKVIQDSWARLCDNYRFITVLPTGKKNLTEILYNRLKLAQPPGFDNDKYNKLTDKVYLTIKYIYNKYNNYDWYLKADDDTFIFVNNLRKFLSDKNSSQPVTYGYDFKVIVKNGYHSGGAGYVLSREAMLRLGKQLSDNYTFCPNTGTEDVDVAKCLRELEVFPNSSIDDKQRERFHPLSLMDHYNGNFPDWLYEYSKNPVKNGTECCSDSLISFHYVSENDVKTLNSILKQNSNNRNLTFEYIKNQYYLMTNR